MNSSAFVTFGFFVAAVLLYYAVKPRFRFAVLLGLSVGYYGLSGWGSLLFVIPLIGVNFAAARAIVKASPAAKRRFLIAIIAADIAVWIFFKIPREGAPVAPLGISFFTFALIGFQADVFRRKNAFPFRFLDLGFFVLWAPKVSQGPIERYDRFMSQKGWILDFSNRRMTSGLRLILFGLFKKFVIADRLGPFVAYVYDQSVPFAGVVYFVATVFFAFQIYADFSGYTDIARGVSRLFGYELILNFQRPYLAKSIREFWKRWHISLSSWLRDYIYLPVAYRISRRLKGASYLGV
ncbi:MAG: MBOAT family O-acyltransferase, partial [Candidatus Aminicenantales bacterium]